jgi:RNA polymerase sigma-70 factor (ECF subfamily)
MALRVTRDADLAADAVQEGFATALEKLGSFRGDSRLGTWVYRIVYNKAIDQLRRRQREEPLPEDEPDPPASQVQPGHGPSWSGPPDELLFSAETHRALEQAMAELPPVQRAVFTLREIEGRPTEEVGRILDLPAGTLRVYLHRARLRLRDRLGPHFRRSAT